MSKKKKFEVKYKYYQFIVRIRGTLGPATLEALKHELWEYLSDVSRGDIQARQCSMPTIRFEGDKVVRN